MIKYILNSAELSILGQVWQRIMEEGIEVLFIAIMISFAVGGVIVFFLVKNAGGKRSVNFRTYAPSGGRLLSASDRYTHSTETRVYVPPAKSKK